MQNRANHLLATLTLTAFALPAPSQLYAEASLSSQACVQLANHPSVRLLSSDSLATAVQGFASRDTRLNDHPIAKLSMNQSHQVRGFSVPYKTASTTQQAGEKFAACLRSTTCNSLVVMAKVADKLPKAAVAAATATIFVEAVVFTQMDAVNQHIADGLTVWESWKQVHLDNLPPFLGVGAFGGFTGWQAPLNLGLAKRVESHLQTMASGGKSQWPQEFEREIRNEAERVIVADWEMSLKPAERQNLGVQEPGSYRFLLLYDTGSRQRTARALLLYTHSDNLIDLNARSSHASVRLISQPDSGGVSISRRRRKKTQLETDAETTDQAAPTSVSLKPLIFEGDSLEVLRSFPEEAQTKLGEEIKKLERGERPTDSKKLRAINQGAFEIRLRSKDGGYRVIYTLSYGNAVHILSAFSKKTDGTNFEEMGKAKHRIRVVAERY